MSGEMRPLSEQAAREHVGPHFGALHRIISTAWGEYVNGYSDEQKNIHCSTTRANIVRDHMVRGAATYFSTVSGARLVDLQKMKVVILDDQIAIRFKKFDRDFIPSNQPTKQVRDFRGQRPMDGMDAVYHLEAGYILDTHEQHQSMICLVCPSGEEENAWHLELTPTSGISTVRNLFEQEEVEEGRNLIKPRAPKKKIERDEEGGA